MRGVERAMLSRIVWKVEIVSVAPRKHAEAGDERWSRRQAACFRGAALEIRFCRRIRESMAHANRSSQSNFAKQATCSTQVHGFAFAPEGLWIVATGGAKRNPWSSGTTSGLPRMGQRKIR